VPLESDPHILNLLRLSHSLNFHKFVTQGCKPEDPVEVKIESPLFDAGRNLHSARNSERAVQQQPENSTTDLFCSSHPEDQQTGNLINRFSARSL
jgi:hypothetical protein